MKIHDETERTRFQTLPSDSPGDSPALDNSFFELREALIQIIDSTDKATNYAVNYARVALAQLRREEYTALQVQLLYVLNNITYWRKPPASSVRRTLKEAIRNLK